MVLMLKNTYESRSWGNKPFQPLFSCSGIHLDLGGREILRNINVHVGVGEVLGVIGPNGAGKTEPVRSVIRANGT
ncbi:hypothetical protein MTX20_02365 [Bradyrhizobium sp. ISRA435]|nr:hypothetical protein MTX20_02365 [Bradyrhizobium sp. ISRA435]